MADLLEGQWELDGFVFGGPGHAVWLSASGLDYGSADSRVQDADNPVGDGSLFGRDYLSGPEWSLTLNVQDGIDVWPVVAALHQAWRADAVRATPGGLSTLRYREAGTTYRVMGRPRKFGVVPARKKNVQFQQITATFQLAGPERYVEAADQSARSLTIPLVESATTGGGWVWPITWPVSLQPSSQAGHGVVSVGGMLPAPFTATVYGPVTGSLSGVKLSGNGWQIETSASIAYDQKLVIDTRTQSITVGGQSVAGTLTRKSRLTARLQPGSQQITFTGVDPSNTARAVLTWFDTIPA